MVHDEISSPTACNLREAGGLDAPQPRECPEGSEAAHFAPAADATPRPARLTVAQRRLVEDNLGLVHLHLRNRVPTPPQPTRQREYDDLFQEGCMALIRAAMSYDPQCDGPFAAYALPRIRGAVHTVVHEYFATVRVPVATLKAARHESGEGSAAAGGVCPVVELSTDLVRDLSAQPAAAGEGETIRHVLRQRYERAIRLALVELSRRTWRHRNPLAIMKRVASERLLISSGDRQTPLRQIAREAGVSSGRACDYERILIEAVRRCFAMDVQVHELLALARADAAGQDAIVDGSLRAKLEQIELESFQERFTHLSRTQQAELVYDMIERTTTQPAEVVRNLYILSQLEDPVLLCAVA